MPTLGPFGRGRRWLLLLAGGALLLGACDGSGSKRAALYQQLTGTWAVERLEETDGGFDHTSRLEERYAWVRFDFREENGRSYRITARPRNDTTVVLAEGPVELTGERVLHMAGFRLPSGARRMVTASFRFDFGDPILRLQAGQQNGSRAFLGTLLPGMSWSESYGVRVELAPVEEEEE